MNAAIDCDTPSAKMNCSRSSMFVRPLARHGSFFTKNSSRATQPPPTRTITVLRKIRTSRNFCESPKRYFPSPTWKTRNFCRHVHNMTKRLTSSWILSASLGALRSCQSGRRAAINSCQSMSPSPLRSNKSATAPISKRDVSNLVLMMPSMNMSLGMSPLLSLSILRKRSVNLDFLWFMNFKNLFLHSSQLN